MSNPLYAKNHALIVGFSCGAHYGQLFFTDTRMPHTTEEFTQLSRMVSDECQFKELVEIVSITEQVQISLEEKIISAIMVFVSLVLTVLIYFGDFPVHNDISLLTLVVFLLSVSLLIWVRRR